MNRDLDKLTTYIQQHLHHSVDEEYIRSTLLQQGWDNVSIEAAFAAAKNDTSETAETTYELIEKDTSSPYPRYGVFESFADTIRAFRHNAVALLVLAVLSYVISVGLLFGFAFIASQIFLGSYGFLFESTAKIIATLIGLLVLYTIWYALSEALIMMTTARAFYDGSRRRKSSIKHVLIKSPRLIIRMMLTNMLTTIVVIWPAVIIAFSPIVFLFTSDSALYSSSSSAITIVFYVAAFSWLLIATARYALAPYVALFEPDIRVLGTLKRSSYLQQKGGQWFVVKGLFILIVLLIAYSIVKKQTLSSVLDTENPIEIIGIILLTLLINGVLVMLYQWRKLVRS